MHLLGSRQASRQFTFSAIRRLNGARHLGALSRRRRRRNARHEVFAAGSGALGRAGVHAACPTVARGGLSHLLCVCGDRPERNASSPVGSQKGKFMFRLRALDDYLLTSSLEVP